MSFEELYIQIRKKEGFLYDDKIVKQLPYPGSHHEHSGLWKKRAKSCSRFMNYLHRNPKFRKVLDFGCGNGWFTARISEIPETQVSGWDINRTELEQAKRLFQKENIRFERIDICTHKNAESFDLIVVNACIQYFRDLNGLIHILQNNLKSGGEIHILDSPFYSKLEAIRAKSRSEQYFQHLQYPQMSEYYYHHSWEELERFSIEIKHNPNTIRGKIISHLITNTNPFPWIVIRS